MTAPVIACLDEGPAGAAAARLAGSLARRLCSPLVLATVAAPWAPGGPDGELGSSPVARARAVLLSQGASIFADAAVDVGPDPELRIELGEPAERLASLAQQTGARLLVVGVPDRCSVPGRALGNVYLALAGTSPCPVVVVPPSMEALGPVGAPILCGVDGSDESLRAAGVAVDLARRLDAPVQLVHIAERPRLSGSRMTDGGYGARVVASHAAAMRVLLRAANLPQAAPDLRVELGGAAERLADIATREGAQLIVNGSRGRGARSSALVGSVSSCLALTASQPLVLVRAGGRAAVVADGRHKVPTRDLQAFSAWEHRGNSARSRRFARERART
jgi:nucleotide-binding universal stress UspA family protein